MMVRRVIAACAIAGALSGCVEIDGVLDVKPDGSAVNRVELRLETKVVREMDVAAAKLRRQKPPPPADQTKAFAQTCADLADPNARAADEPRWPQVPTTAAVTVRGKWTVCTVTETIADPAAHYTDVSAKLGSADDTFERIEGGSAYRYASSIRINRLFASMKLVDNDGSLFAGLAALVPTDASLTFSIRSARISETDGKVAADGRSVRWTFPLRRFLDLSEKAQPLESRALIHFR